MGVRLPSVATAPQQSGVSLVTTSETVIATLPPLNISLDFAQILLFWSFAYLAGTAATQLFINIRRGTGLTGTIINLSNNWDPTVVAASNYMFAGNYGDVPGAIAGQQYVLTAKQVSATGNGSVTDPVFMAVML